MAFSYNLESWKALSNSHLEQLVTTITQASKRALARKCYYVHIRDYYIIMILLHTGLRNSELRNLKIEDFDLKQKTLTVVNGKGGKSRRFYISQDTVDLLKQYLLHKATILKEPISSNDWLFLSGHYKQYTSNNLWQRVKYWMKKAQLPDYYTVHSLRHTHACISLESDAVPLTQIQANLGHSERKTTEIYIHMRRNGMPNVDFTGVKNKKSKRFL